MFRNLALIVCLLATPAAYAQSINGGTVEGSVVDQTGAVVSPADILIHNVVTGYEQKATTDANGVFRLTNLPPNTYHLEVKAPGFATFSQEVVIRNSVPVQVKAALGLAKMLLLGSLVLPCGCASCPGDRPLLDRNGAHGPRESR